MRIVGIDIDSRKFGAVMIEKKDSWDCFHLSTCKNVDDRIAELYDEMEKLLIRWAPDIVFIEAPIYIQNFKTTQSISEAVGNCKSLCRRYKILYEVVPNKTWKKEIIGNGNCTKEDTRKFIEKKYAGFIDKEQDCYDAFGLCLFGIKRMKETKLGKI